MKRRELYMFMQSLNNLGNLKGVKFAYSIIKNKKKIEEEIKILEEVVKPSDEFSKYEAERIELCELHCEKDDKGEPVVEDDKYKIIDESKFDKELETLKESYNTYITEREDQIKDYNKMLDDEIEMDFAKVNFDELPTDISTTQLESITFMLDLD